MSVVTKWTCGRRPSFKELWTCLEPGMTLFSIVVVYNVLKPNKLCISIEENFLFFKCSSYSDEKDEEDMSLDSGDEISQIEVCSNFHSEILEKETKGSIGFKSKRIFKLSCNRLWLTKSLLEDETYQIDSAERASIDTVCLKERTINSVEQRFSAFRFITVD